MDDASILVIARVAERLLVVFCGGLSLTFGWNLFRIGVVDQQTAEFSRAEFSVRLSRVGPGTFFALFGASLLAVSLYQSLILHETSDARGNRSAQLVYLAEGDEQGTLQHVLALNSQIQILTPRNLERLQTPAGEADWLELLQTIDTIKQLRNQLVIRRFGVESLQIWNTHGEQFMSHPHNAPEIYRNLLSNMVTWMKDTLPPAAIR